MHLGGPHKFTGQQLLEDQWIKTLLTTEEYEATEESIGNTAGQELEVQKSSGEERLFELLRKHTTKYQYTGNQSLKNARLVGAIIVKLEELEKLSLEQISIKLGGGWGKSQLGKFKAFFLLVREFPLLMRLGGVFASTIMNNLKPLREYLTTSAGSALLSLSVFVSLSHTQSTHRQQVAREVLGETSAQDQCQDWHAAPRVRYAHPQHHRRLGGQDVGGSPHDPAAPAVGRRL